MNSTIVVPRIIHNTWKTADIPPEWQFCAGAVQKGAPRLRVYAVDGRVGARYGRRGACAISMTA